jgi:hypothetical protein
VATGQIDPDGFADVLVAPKAGRRGRLKVINGRTGAVSRAFFAFGRGHRRGVALAAGDLDGNGRSEIVAGRATGRRSHIKVFDGAGRLLHRITAFRGIVHRGLSLSTLDVNGDGRADIVATSRGRHTVLREVFDGETGLRLGGIIKLPAGPAAHRPHRS